MNSQDKIISESGKCYQEINQGEGKMLTGFNPSCYINNVKEIAM